MTIWESLRSYGNVKEQCLLIGKVKSMSEAGYSELEIARIMNISVDFTREIMEMIKYTEEIKKYEEESE